MKSDNTRPTFNKPRRYTRLIFQQGRPPVDADFNEAHEIQLQMLRSYAADIIGEHGASDADAFLIKPEPDSTNDGKTPVTDLTIGKGRYYVDGVQCENDGAFPGWRTQPFGVPAADGEIKETISVPVLVYLDVWEHHRTWIEDGVLRDPALGGTDTGTRSRVVWQVRLLAKDALPVNEKKTDLDWKHALELENRRNQGKLRVRFNPGAHSGSDCDVHADARYRGAENQLYRVEIHRPGKALTAKADPNDSKDPDKKNFLDERASAATFKWSRENGSVVARWVKARDCDPADGNVLRIQGPRDEVHGFSAGDWIEITGEMDDLRRRAGVFARIKRAEGDALTLEEPLGEALPAWDKLKNPKVRRWDQRDSGNYFFDRGALVIRETENVRGGTQPVWIPLENGLEIQFKEGEKDPHDYRTGDYWLIPVRIATGDLLWPWRDPSPDADAGADEAQPPHGIEHHYAPLAIVDEISAGGTEKKAAKKAAKKAVSEAGEKPPSLIDLRRVITPVATTA